MSKPTVSPKHAKAKPVDDLHYLEDRLGYLKRMIKGMGAALEAHHGAYGHTEHKPDDQTCCFFELLDREFEGMTDLAEELENKAFALRTRKAVA